MGATLLCSVCFRSPTIVQLTPTYSWFIIWEFSICGFFCGKSNVGCIQWLRGGGRNTQKDSQKLVILIFLNLFFLFFYYDCIVPSTRRAILQLSLTHNSGKYDAFTLILFNNLKYLFSSIHPPISSHTCVIIQSRNRLKHISTDGWESVVLILDMLSVHH